MARKRTSSPKQQSIFGAEPEEDRSMGSVEAKRWSPRTLSTTQNAWEHSPHVGWKHTESGAQLPVLVGVDEAGRGPLAGPVSVAAVVLAPEQVRESTRPDWLRLVHDSKKLTESKRDKLFPKIVSEVPAWCVVHLHRDIIDAHNILQATWMGMAYAVERVLGVASAWEPAQHATVCIQDSATERTSEDGCWYASAFHEQRGARLGVDVLASQVQTRLEEPSAVRVLVDGHMPFRARSDQSAHWTQEPLVKGDGRSLHIAAASILAKVTRDRAMKHAGELWSVYGFEGHKGYPTKAHKAALQEHGPCAWHRRSFSW